ncbi:helix-hairpin-helix domain-containing protein [Arthrobacter sp. ATA002]|uniref:helix-hairpin-helix domain-containing protein n=1 Tax=Arthrobacter sp. ATA002 TaxID=2991715 RepID=UPI0022A7EA5B|nr:helix-hairpin-helix domain-containing protein [Arthrobacter sp. ATA002]WAP53137.1 helix-hairpin-helix domain-containing protein [Arthrobacter sp. ATA002]
MANHRWETSPPLSRLSVPRSGPAESQTFGDGEPADDPDLKGSPTRHRRRWLMSFRASVLAVSLLAGTAGGLVLFKGGGPPVQIASVELDTDRSVSPADEGAEARSAADDSAGQDHGEARGGGEAADPAPSPVGPSVLVVHVAGAVTSPGVVRVPSGSRNADAVEAAGGAAPDADLTAVNLAAPLQDGMMVIVPRIGEEAAVPVPVAGADGGAGAPGSGPGTGMDPDSEPGALVNINTASLQELDALPRVGPVTAERIVAWRNEHGNFARPEDIDAVPGIGEAMLAALLPLITV